MLRCHWKLIMFLGLSAVLVYNIVYVSEDNLRNIYLAIRVHTSLLFTAPPTAPSTVDCTALIRGDKTEILKARMSKSERAEGDVPRAGESCEDFKRNRRYILNVSKEESEFPLAFGVLVYKNSHQVERLLRAIYRPSNVYCIHVDRKSEAMLEEMRRLVACFDNMFLSSRQIDVRWGEFSVLESELVCMEDLLHQARWRYFINLTGQEFPLKTNLQLVRILSAYNGANDVSGTTTRYNENIRRFWRAGAPPHGLTPVIGSVHVVVNRHFVNFSVHHPVAKDLQNWLHNTEIPDETYFPTLNFNPQLNIPGTFKGVPRPEPFLARYKLWDHGLLLFRDECMGRYQREVCVLGVGDLAGLLTQRHLFVNKFEEDFQPAALNCVEEWYHNTTRWEQRRSSVLDTSFYSQLDFVQNQVKES